ncbi:hypothetical protein A4X09_0g7853, partial [Tilletia walkeri]
LPPFPSPLLSSTSPPSTPHRHHQHPHFIDITTTISNSPSSTPHRHPTSHRHSTLSIDNPSIPPPSALHQVFQPSTSSQSSTLPRQLTSPRHQHQHSINTTSIRPSSHRQALKSDTIRPSSDPRQALKSATIRPSSDRRQALKSATIRPSSYRQVLKSATIRPSSYRQVLKSATIRPSSYRQVLKSATIRRPPFVGSFGASSIPNLLRSHGYGTGAPALGRRWKGVSKVEASTSLVVLRQPLAAQLSSSRRQE